MKQNHARLQCQGPANPKLQKAKRETACSGQQSCICVDGVCRWRSVEIPVFFYLLTESSYAVLHSAWKTCAVKCSWAVISGAVNEHWFTSLGDKSTFWPSVNTRIWFSSDSHRCQAELPSFKSLVCLGECYLKVGPLARFLNESHSVGQRSCLSGWFVHSWTWEGPTANKNLAFVMKCQCAALKLLALQ